MASEKTLYRRMAAEADERRIVRAFFMQPPGHKNRHERRCKGRCALCRAKDSFLRLINDLREKRLNPRADAATEIESEAPT
jgi:hypothetical protein